ncbi:hypothetical protein SAMN04487785_102432 [Dyella jiangningensis]|uniref:hypothetical protein n=1 Tax=Dyella sp. AtDHG13 TaxID=1938897 RepID=UPI000889C76D|nr:hypothetical protein [Dyella sp. AtDHG13]PXV60704.1 hypothetical protein BDW41_102431 [Dyella sp. AtDHG13]SDJ55821.1 hypothetical protein SAMN04487785_102432 [Dyella jiangningensis]
MSMFDRPGAMAAAKEWNAAREAESAAQLEYDAAREKHWAALVRMANAHKSAVETVGPEYADVFLWIDELHGKRDQILASTAIAKSTEAANG